MGKPNNTVWECVASLDDTKNSTSKLFHEKIYCITAHDRNTAIAVTYIDIKINTMINQLESNINACTDQCYTPDLFISKQTDTNKTCTAKQIKRRWSAEKTTH